MDMGRISLKFPLNLNVEDVLILDENQDTMVYAGNALVDVKLVDIMKLQLDIPKVEVQDVVYNMVSVDSSMILRARLDNFALMQSDVTIETGEVNLGKATLKGGDLTMIIKSVSADSVPVDTASSELPWIVNIGRFQMEDVAVKMEMLPTIKNLDAMIGKALLREASVDLGKLDVKLKYLGVDSADVKYIYPTSEWIAAHPVTDEIVTTEEPTDTAMWTINADVIRLNDSHAIYAMDGAEPVNGLDMNYMEISDLNIGLDSVYNRGTDIRLFIANMSARERCGLFVTSGSGAFSMDSEMMRAEKMRIETMQSKVQLNAEVGMDFSTEAETPINLDMKANIGVGEIGRAYPDLIPMLKHIPQYNPVELNLALDGNTKKLDIATAVMELPRYLKVDFDGNLSNVMDMDNIGADVTFDGDFQNIEFMKPIMLSDTTMYKTIDFPAMKLSGHANYKSNFADAEIDLGVENGLFALKGKWNGLEETYEVDIDADSFPVQALLPTLNIKDLTMRFKAAGDGYDVTDLATKLDIDFMVRDVEFEGKKYINVGAAGLLENAYLSMDLSSNNADCVMDMTLSCMFNKDCYEVGVDGIIKNLDLKSMCLTEDKSHGKGKIKALAMVDFENGVYEADINLNDFEWNLPDVRYSTPAIEMTLLSSHDSLALYAAEEDLYINFNTATGLDSIMACVERCQAILDYEIKNKYLDVDTLQETLPTMLCELRVGKNNLVQQALNSYGFKMRSMSLDLKNDSTINMKAYVQELEAFAMKIDTIDMDVSQRNKYMSYKFHAGSQPGTNDEFAQVTIKGGVRGNRLGILLDQKNIRGEQGFNLGLDAVLGDTLINMSIFPRNPIIGYRKWKVNDNNIVEYNYLENYVNANLDLKCDSSYVRMIANHREIKERSSQDVNLSIGGVQISEWVKVSPFIPPMSGELSADMKMKYNGKHLWGMGKTHLEDFKFNRKAVGDFDLNLGLTLDSDNSFVRLMSSFEIDGKRTLIARGVLNDTTAKDPFRLKLQVDSFPLRITNPFIPGNMANLQGLLYGDMDVVGNMSNPILNGYVRCQSAEIDMPLFGSHLALSDNKIPVDSSVIRFDGFKIVGSNKNTINMTGYVDMLSFDNPKFDIKMRGRNVEFVNSKQRRKMEVFGKGYANVDVTAKGSMNDMNIDAALTILPATNLTYVMQTDVTTIATQTDDSMVKFVDFSDTTQVVTDSVTVQATTSTYAMNAKLTIQEGAKFSVYLDDSGNDRVEVEGSGTLNYSESTLGDERLTGKLTVNNGYVKYTPPLLSEKRFEFVPGSNISWTGDMFNPILDIHGEDELRASVSHEGQDSRMINFLVSVGITNTLNNMDLNFDLSTNEDMTVQNELLSMSPAQRSSQAINLLLYGTYTGMGTASGISGNPLYSFLNSQINRWAANTIKGVDVTLGVNQYGSSIEGDVAKSTSYSYKISKSLFNDRFKIVVGGSYNTGDNIDDNLANSLFNDISFVYNLNQSGTMQVKLFRQTGFESVLEGEVTETGGAFVMKRKMSSLRNLFRIGKAKKNFRQMKPEVRDSVSAKYAIPEERKQKLIENEK